MKKVKDLNYYMGLDYRFCKYLTPNSRVYLYPDIPNCRVSFVGHVSEYYARRALDNLKRQLLEEMLERGETPFEPVSLPIRKLVRDGRICVNSANRCADKYLISCTAPVDLLKYSRWVTPSTDTSSVKTLYLYLRSTVDLDPMKTRLEFAAYDENDHALDAFSGIIYREDLNISWRDIMAIVNAGEMKNLEAGFKKVRLGWFRRTFRKLWRIIHPKYMY